MLDTSTFMMLQRLQVPFLWVFNHVGRGYRYVRLSAPEVRGAMFAVARIIAQAGAGESVHYLDGNRLNLRRDNLRGVKASRVKNQLPERWRFPEGEEAKPPIRTGSVREAFIRGRAAGAFVIRRKKGNNNGGAETADGAPA